MYLRDWDPHVTGKLYGSDLLRDQALHVTAVLGCPCCGHEHAVRTDGHLLGSQTSLSDTIRWTIDELKKRRDCDECGITSTLPSDDCNQLQKEATERITPEWIAGEEEKLKAEYA